MMKHLLNLLFYVTVFSANAQFAPLSHDVRYAHRDVFDLSCMMQACTAKGNKVWFDENCRPEFQTKEGIWKELPKLWETYSLYSKSKAIETINQLDKAAFSEEERIWATLQLYLIDKDVSGSKVQFERLRKLNPESYLLLFSEINEYLYTNMWLLEEEKTRALLERAETALKNETLPANQQVFLQLAEFDLKKQLSLNTESKEAFIARLWKEHPEILVPGMVETILSKQKEEYAQTLNQINLTTEKNLSIKTLKLLRSPLLDYSNPVALKQLLSQSTPKEQLLIKTLAFVHVSNTDDFSISKSLLGEWGSKMLFPDGDEKRRFSEAFRKELLVKQSREEWNALIAEITGTKTQMGEEELQKLIAMTPKGMSPDEAVQLGFGIAIYFHSASETFAKASGFSFLTQGGQKSAEEEDLESVDTFIHLLRTNPYFDLREQIVLIDRQMNGGEEGKVLFFSTPDQLVAAIDQFKLLEKEFPASPIVKNNLLAVIRYCTRLDTNYRTEAIIRAYAQTYIDLMCLAIQHTQPDSGFLVDDGVKMMGDESDGQRVFGYFTEAEIREIINRLKTIDQENTNGDIAKEMIEYLENFH